MPYSRHRHAEKHFTSLHFGGKTSAFSSVFPVNLDSEDIQHILGDLPDLADDVLLQHSHSESLETTAKGKIALRPEATSLAMERMVAPEKDVMRSRHLILKAMSDFALVQSAHAQVHIDGGDISNFSLVTHTIKDSRPVAIEVRGVMDDFNNENLYEVAAHRNGDEISSYIVPEDVVADYVHALIELREGKEVYVPNLEIGLRSLIDLSPQYIRDQKGEFKVPDTETGVLSAGIERVTHVRKGLTSTSLLAIRLLEETSFDDMTATSTFMLTQERSKTGPVYSADYNMLIVSNDPTQTHLDREAIFQLRSCFLRENPIVLFDAVRNALETLAKIES